MDRQLILYGRHWRRGSVVRWLAALVGLVVPAAPVDLVAPAVLVGPLAGLIRLIAALELLHLPLQLFGFATQHLLFPTLPEGLLLILLGGQFLLAPGEFGELLERVVDLLGTRVTGRLLAGFVLVLLAVELQVGEVLQVAAHASTAASTTAPASEGNLDIAESIFGAKSVLQCLLFRSQGFLELLRPQFLR